MKTTIALVGLALIFAALTTSASTQERGASERGATYSEGLAAANAAFFEMLRERAERLENESLDAVADTVDAARDQASRMRLANFQEDVYAFVSGIEALFPLRGVPISEPVAVAEIERVSRDLETTTRRLRDFINFANNPPQINVAPLPDENVDTRIQRLVILSRRLIPNIIAVGGAGSLDLNLLNLVRDDLAIAEALILALPQSRF
jgi:hypothetical protein